MTRSHPPPSRADPGGRARAPRPRRTPAWWGAPLGYGMTAWAIAAALLLTGSDTASLHLPVLMLGLAPGALAVPCIAALGTRSVDHGTRADHMLVHGAIACVVVTFSFQLARMAPGGLPAALPTQVVYGVASYSLVVGASALGRHRGQRAQWRTTLVEAQDAAMRARLNPHFLFNSLHAVASLVRHSPEAATDALLRLGELLRYVLDEETQGEVPLRREWEFVEGYLWLERLRLGERLAVDLAIDPETLALPIPSLCLQPLVENAVRHGIAPRASGGRITIAVQLQNESLVLRVSNTGQGTPPTEALAGPGLGLRAVRARIEHRDAGAGRLELASSPDQGFTAVVTLPVSASPTRLRHPHERGHAHRR